MKGAHPRIVRRLTALAGGLALVLGVPSARGAAPILPSGASVIAGHASIAAPSETSTLVTQSSQKALIDWQSFSIGAGSSVTFQQPNSAAITLNRVVGPNASAINGSLFANGQVWLINGNGILFGHGSRIDVGGLIATTSDMRDTDFLAGRYDFATPSGNPNAAVINQGSIKAATGGSAVLSGPRVVNDGVIEANLGKVVLAGSNAFSVDFDGDNLIRFAIAAPVSETPKVANGESAPALVSNSGTIAADGGKVLLTARAARSVVNNVINSTGIVEATSVSLQNGEIVLDAGEGGTARVAGRLDVSGVNAGETGGTIALLADTVTVADGATLDASGHAGGGTVLAGGNLHGAGPEANAEAVNIGEAVISADATANGDGGTVAIYSTGTTAVTGSLSARGGVQGGDGGTIETSGASLNVAETARIDTSAVNGATGTWLLDPLNISVATGGATSLSGGVLAAGTDPGATDTVAPATIVTALATTNVRLEATNDITVANMVSYTSANSLTFLAGHNVTFNASVQNGGAGAIFAVAGWDGVTAAANILATPGAYGGNSGSVLIGGAGASSGVGVGSLNGTTTVASRNLSLNALNGYAQLGHSGAGNGDIVVHATGDLALAGGNGVGLFAQVGHGGYFSNGTSDAAVTAAVSGNVTLTGGGGTAAYTQLGHGGASSSGGRSGDLVLTAGGALVLTVGAGTNAYVQIGHGGASSSGNRNGDFTVTAGGDFALTGSAIAYARIGNGSSSSSGFQVGDIAILAGGDIALSTAQIGNGGVYSGKVLVAGSGDLTLGSGVSINANNSGNAIVLATGGNFVNQAGGAALNVSGGGRWLVFSHDPSKTTPGGLSATSLYNYAFNFSNGTYPAIPGTSNQFVYLLPPTLTITVDNKTRIYATANPALTYSITGLLNGDVFANVASGAPSLSTAATTSSNAGDYPILGSLGTLASATYGFLFVDGTLHIDPATLTAGLTGSVAKTYDRTTAATLAAGNYTLTGVVPGDAVVLNNPAAGIYDTRNVGTSKLVSVSGLALSGADAANYVLASTGASAAIGIINPATLNAGLTGSASKIYDGTTAATLASGNYSLTGVIAGDVVVLNNPAAGNYDNKNAGTFKTVSVSGLALSGADAANYVLASTGVSATIGAIGMATLNAGLTGSVSKTYDGTTAATLASGNYTLAGVVSGDAVALNNPAAGSYDTKNVGASKTVSVSGLALSGADAANYALASTGASAAIGTINAATLNAGLTGSVSKTYDGTTAATLASGNYTLAGVVSGDAVALNNPAAGSYDTKNVGASKTVSVSGLALSGADAANYALASTGASAAIGTINAATLNAGLTGSVSKTYDGMTAATLASGNYTLAGVMSGDAVVLNNPAAGSYDSKNVGTSKTVSVSGLALSGADAANYVLASTGVSAAIGTIGTATLNAGLTGSVSKTYDGTTAATLAPANYTLTGIVSGDAVALNNPANGSYDNRNAGTSKLISVSGLALLGADAANYVLSSTSASAAIGTITAANTLIAGLTGNVSKTYDGTASATLTSANYTLSGVVSGDVVVLNNPATGSYDSKNVGTSKTVSVSGLALLGADAGNYVLASTNASAAIGTINAATLNAGLTGSVSKTYDGTVAATLTSGNYTLAGVVSGDAVALNNPAAGTYDSRNAGTSKTVSVSGLALSGADAANYVLASTGVSAAIGTIGTATLNAGLAGSVSKTYDGTTAATLASGNYTLAGVVSGDAVALNNPTSGSYDNKSAGLSKTVSVSGLALSGADSANYVLASTGASAAIGTIGTATLNAGLTGSVSKTYDGTVAATLTSGNYTLAGVVSGDAVVLNNPAAGSYDNKSANVSKSVNVSGLALSGTDAANYVLASTNASAAIGTINAATLNAGLTGSVSKTYDGTTAATLASGNYTLTGVVSGDAVALSNPAAGSYGSKNVGTSKTVSVSGLALSGADAANYVLASTSATAAIGTINAATLNAGLTGSVSKTYDGTVAATLTSGNYTLAGVVSGDTVVLNNPATGSYGSKNVGASKTVSVSGLALSGTDAANYVLASTNATAAIGTINAATLNAGLTGSVSKTYDGTTAATLASGNYTLSGAISGDAVALNNPAAGSYDSKNVGTSKTVSVSGLALSGADGANYMLASANVSAVIGTIIDSNTLTIDNGILASLTKGAFGSALDALGQPLGAADTAGGGMMTATGTGALNGESEVPIPSDSVAITVGQSLSSEAGIVASRTIVLIGGLLRQFVPAAGASTLRGVPPADWDYSSWGNEALWQ